jgi:hypothetical protein
MTTSKYTAPAALPVIGGRTITEAPNEHGHFLWLSLFGWHDCTNEDIAIRNTLKPTENAT